MAALELDEIEIDYCMECRGIWLDAGELELLVESAEKKDRVLNSFVPDNASKETKLRCPICGRMMKKVLCCGDKVRVDKCRKGDGIWFDKGELYSVVKAGVLDKDNKIIDLMKDIFKKDFE